MQSRCNDREWNKQIRDGNDGGTPRGPHRLLRQDRSKHQCRRRLLQRQRYHIISVSGPTSNQVSTTRVVSKCQTDDQIAATRSFSIFEQKTEQPNSESWHRCFIFSVLVNSNMAELHAKKGGQPKKRFQYCVDPFSAYAILYLRANRRKTHHSYITRQRVTTRRLRRAHLPRWKLPRYVLDDSIWIDSGWQKTSR